MVGGGARRRDGPPFLPPPILIPGNSVWGPIQRPGAGKYRRSRSLSLLLTATSRSRQRWPAKLSPPPTRLPPSRRPLPAAAAQRGHRGCSWCAPQPRATPPPPLTAARCCWASRVSPEKGRVRPCCLPLFASFNPPIAADWLEAPSAAAQVAAAWRQQPDPLRAVLTAPNPCYLQAQSWRRPCWARPPPARPSRCCPLPR
jgi:hypothetical protein